MSTSNLLDQIMTAIESKQMWRKAAFLCSCIELSTVAAFKDCSFCITYSYLVPHSQVADINRCYGCNINDSWETVGHPCLACQFANVVFCNPFDQ